MGPAAGVGLRQGSFLRTYGDYLGLDSRLLVDEFKRRYERPSDHEARAMATTARERDRRSSRQPSRASDLLFSPRTVIVLALVVIVAALYVIGNQGGKSGPSSGKITPATTGTTRHHTGTKTGPGRNAHDRPTPRRPTTNTVTTPLLTSSLKLVPTTTVWICVENQTGKPLMTAGDYTVGQTIPTFHSRQLLLTLGNAGGD